METAPVKFDDEGKPIEVVVDKLKRSLDPVQKEKVTLLVMSRIKKVRKDIIMDDDEMMMAEL